MKNALATVKFTLDIPEGKLVELVGRRSEETVAWENEACDLVEHWIRDHVVVALEAFTIGEPEIECKR